MNSFAEAVFGRFSEGGRSMPPASLGAALRQLHLAPSAGQLQQYASRHAQRDGSLSRVGFDAVVRACSAPLLVQRADFVACLRMLDRYGHGRIELRELRRTLCGEGEAMAGAEADSALAMLAGAVTAGDHGKSFVRPDRVVALLF
eukprot:g6203.t1